jgi:O-antigen/teichoic acid export membrane protein
VRQDDQKDLNLKALTSAISALRSGEGLKGQLLRGGVGSIAVKLGSTGLNVLLAVVMARTLGVEGFGIYSFVFAVITILAIPAEMGLPNLVVRETAKAQATGDWALMRGLWRWSTLLALGMAAALMTAGGLAAWIFAANLPEGGLSVFYWGLLLVPLVALGNLRGAAMRGLRHVVQGQLPEFILRPAFLIVLVLGAYFGLSTRAVTASDAMMLHALASLVAFAIGSWMLLRVRPGELTSMPDRKVHSRSWLAASLPLGLLQGMSQITSNTDTLVLGIYATPEEIGLYRVAFQGAALISIGVVVGNAVLAPYIAQMHAKGDYARLRLLSTAAAWAISFTAFIIFIVYLIFGSGILVLFFGEEYAGAYFPLLVLGLAQLINAMTATSGLLLMMTGHEKTAAKIVAFFLVVNIGLNFLLVPLFGALGAASATALTVSAKHFVHRQAAKKLLGVDGSILGQHTTSIEQYLKKRDLQ